MNRTIPELQGQITDLLAGVKPEQLLRLDREPDALRCLQDALMKTRDVLKLSSPSAGVVVKTATKWFACHPDSPHDQLNQDSAGSYDDLFSGGMPSSGYILVGFTDDHEKIVEGYIAEEGYIEWTYVAEKERREAADHLLGTFTYPEGLSYTPVTMDHIMNGSGDYEWYYGDDNDEWSQDVLVLEGKVKPPVKMSVFLQFAEFSTEIISAKLDNFDIMPKNEQGDVDAPGDVDVPGGDNNSPDEDRGPEPC